MALAIAVALLAAPADAKKTHLPLGKFGGVNPPDIGGVVAMTRDQSTGDLLVGEQTDPINLSEAFGALSRWHSDATAANFSALGTNVIDGKGGGECPAVPSDCDQTPQNGLRFGLFAGEQQIAVDNSGTATDGNIYVTQASPGTGQVVDIFSPTGKYLGQLTGAGPTSFEGTLNPCGVTVAPDGDVFVAGGFSNRIYQFDPSSNTPVNSDVVAIISGVQSPCNLASGMGPTAGSLFANTFYAEPVSKLNASTGSSEYVVTTEGNLVAVDPSTGHLFVYDSNEGFGPEVQEFDASGAAGATLVSTFPAAPTALAVDGSTGKVFVGNGGINVFGPLVAVPDVVTGTAAITGETEARLTGTVNPDGVPVDECFFEYGPTNSYGNTVPCAESAAEIGTGTSPSAVHADVSGLATESVYHVRLVAKNVNDRVNGTDKAFQTPTKPAIEAAWAESVGGTDATLKVKVNPGNVASTVRFEWGPDGNYGESSAEIGIGSDATGHTATYSASGLTPATTYHWRAVATNTLGEVEGSDGSFRTYAEAPAALPDSRAYEMVSPIDKEGGEVGVPISAGGVAKASVQPQQAAASGDAMTFASFTAFGENPESAPAASQYLALRSGSRWITDNITPLSQEGDLRDPIVGFSEDLAHAVAMVIEPELTADAGVDVPNLYLRDNASDELQAITTEEHHPTLAPSVGPREYCLVYGGASADSKHVVFSAKGALLPGDPAGTGFNLYEWSEEGGLKLVSVLPSEVAAVPGLGTSFGAAEPGLGGPGGCNPEKSLMRHAISTDGSRVFWTYYGGAIGTAKEPLLARIGASKTIQLDAPNEGVSGKGGEGKYWDASLDGSKVFFTSPKKLTAAPTTPGSSDLYLYNFNAPEGERLTDLSAHVGEAAGVSGVIGASEDGSYAYFAASGVLTGEEENARGEKAQAGQANLYAWHVGEGVRYIATGTEPSNWAAQPNEQTARLSQDGTTLAFLSQKALTEFDNTARGGAPCQVNLDGTPFGSPLCPELYLYDYDADSVACASCNAAATAPAGHAFVPGWSTPYQQPRYLSRSGDRVFFESDDALDPHDTNGMQDVYEFERVGTGGCSDQSPGFNPASSGCIFLISSGTSSAKSYLLDASDSGDDVFFSTREGLAYNDGDGRYDVYDARVNGRPSQPPPPECEGEGCRGAVSEAASDSRPGTAAFQGPGNTKVRTPCPKGRHQALKAGKPRCVKPKGKKHRKQGTRQNGRTGR